MFERFWVPMAWNLTMLFVVVFVYSNNPCEWICGALD